MREMKRRLERQAAKLGLVGSAAAGFVSNAMAAVDTTGVQAGITAAQTSAEGVGGMVITAVAAIVVIGLIIAIVRKL